MKFQSTLPARGATEENEGLFNFYKISIHAPRTGSDGGRGRPKKTKAISIHAPRTGSDCPHSISLVTAHNFNPRSPHGERRIVMPQGRTRGGFQSTLPARGATSKGTCPERPQHISIHAPRTGSDTAGSSSFRRASLFQSTLPARGATGVPRDRAAKPPDFNPRSPHGERRHRERSGHRRDPISIHAPRTGSDSCDKAQYRDFCHFNPRSPHGERRDDIGSI